MRMVAPAPAVPDTEHDTRAVFHQKPDALVLGHTAIDGISVLENVSSLDNKVSHLATRVGGGRRGHGFHHGSGLGLVNSLVVVPAVVIAPVLLPVRPHDVLDRDKRFVTGRLWLRVV